MTSYWKGPYGVRVSNAINHVIAADGGNTLHKDGMETEMCVRLDPPMNAERYIAKYAELGDDGNYWWKDNAKYWTGPYGIRVPDTIENVVDSDGVNTLHRNGSATEMASCMDPPMNAETYKTTYCELRNGFYWYTGFEEVD